MNLLRFTFILIILLLISGLMASFIQPKNKKGEQNEALYQELDSLRSLYQQAAILKYHLHQRTAGPAAGLSEQQSIDLRADREALAGINDKLKSQKQLIINHFPELKLAQKSIKSLALASKEDLAGISEGRWCSFNIPLIALITVMVFGLGSGGICYCKRG